MTQSKEKIGYVCSTAFDVELGQTDIEVYPTEESLRASCSCVDKNEQHHCGIYKVKIIVEEVIQPEPEWEW